VVELESSEGYCGVIFHDLKDAGLITAAPQGPLGATFFTEWFNNEQNDI